MGYYVDGRLAIENGDLKKAYEIYKTGEGEGDLNAEFGLAEMQWFGWYLDEDEDLAFNKIDKLYKKIDKKARKGDSESQLIIYFIHKNHYKPFVGKGYSYGYEMLKKAVCDKSNSIAIWCMGQLYLECDNGAVIAGKCFEETVALPNTTMFKAVLARYYTRGTGGIPINYERAFELCRAAAEEGLAEAQFDLCGIYLHGRGTAVDTDEAVRWCKLAAENGDEEAAKSITEVVYKRDVAQNRLNTEDALENITELYESGFTQCYVHLVFSLLNNAREKAESKKIDDLIKSSIYFKRLFDIENNYKTLYVKELAKVLYRIAQLLEDDADFEKAKTYYHESIKLGYDRAMFNLATIYYNGKNGVADYSNALYFFKKCTVNGIEEGRSHYYIGSCFYWGLGVPVDYENAKKHFIQAYEYGFNCNSAISLVESELNDGENINSMRSYAESLKKKQLSEEERYARIIKDLQSDFGDAWNKTQADTKKFIATGIDIYISQYFKGPHIFGNYDFSASINEMCKALENELRVHLYSNYILWLQNRGITPNEFLETNNLSSQNVKRSILKRVNSTEFAYEDASKTDKFTLGSVHLTVGKDKGQATIDKTMLDYLDYIFGTHTFDENMRTEEINKYIVSLVDDLWTISELYRNPAAHSRKMDCKKAEACGDYIIKVKKLLIHFLEKIDI